MQSADSSRYINSVSDLYGDDEIEFLLDDIRELEPISCRPEDIQVRCFFLFCFDFFFIF